jgi:hypothetical protein
MMTNTATCDERFTEYGAVCSGTYVYVYVRGNGRDGAGNRGLTWSRVLGGRRGVFEFYSVMKHWIGYTVL